MTLRQPGTEIDGNHPAEAPEGLPAVENITSIGFAALLDRAISIACLAALVPTVVSAEDQLALLDRTWLVVVGGAMVASALLMPVYAWSRRGIRPLAGLYSVAILVGMMTWPLAWTGASDAGAAPMQGVLLGLGAVCMGAASSTRAGVVYGLIAAVSYFVVRLTPSGGQADRVTAVQDAVLVVLQPMAVLFVLQFLRAAVGGLDARLARSHADSADAAVSQALVDERRRLDAIVHDEVLTTLVAAAQSRGPHDDRVAAQAQHAIESLRREASADADKPASADQLVRLVKDVIASVCPRAEVSGEIPAAATTIPPNVVRTLLRAAREAALNAERHADADHVWVDVHVAASPRRVAVRVAVVDDGRGFDADAVSPNRLGIRLALRGRMLTVGGRAELTSAPGRGTSVRLFWSGERARPAPPRRTLANVGRHPLFDGLSSRPLALVAGALTGLYVVIAALGTPALGHPWYSFLGAVVVVAGMGVAVPGILRPPLGALQGWLLVAASVVTTGLCLTALPLGPWSEHSTWFVVPVMILIVLTFAGGQVLAAWTAAVVHLALVGGVAFVTGQSPGTAMVALVPAAWLCLETFFFYWLDSMWAQLDDAERSAEEAAQLNAVMFSKTVLREVWLAELRGQVGPVLARLADATTPLTAADRERCLLLEDGLRDGIKAANFNSPPLSAAIMDARLRGVQVTLVDNRGSRLPEAARRAALRTLDETVRAAASGRIVARTAPEGYGEAVTIVAVDGSGSTRLTRIADDGTVTDAPPVPVPGPPLEGSTPDADQDRHHR